MPGTRRKVAASGSTRTVDEDEFPAKRSRLSKSSDNSEGCGTPQAAVMTSHTSRRKETASTDKEAAAASARFGGKVPEKQAVTGDKPVATPGKQGSPRKENKTDGTSTQSEGKANLPRKDGVKPLLSPKPKESEESSPMFSPRRSSRSVVPNRRFQDMELDLGAIGRKKSKEDAADIPFPKRVKAVAPKKLSSDKIKDSPANSVVAKPDVAEAEARSASRASTTVTDVQTKTVNWSSPASKASSMQSPAPSAQQIRSTVMSIVPTSLPYQQRQQVAATSIATNKVSRTVAVSRSLPSAVTSVSSPQKSAMSLPQSGNVPGMVSVRPNIDSSGIPATSSTQKPKVAALSQHIQTSQSSMVSESSLVTSGASTGVSVSSESGSDAPVFQSHLSQHISPDSEAQTVLAPKKEHIQASAQPHQGESLCQSVAVESDIAIVEDLTEAAEVEIGNESEQAINSSSGVVTINSAAHSLLGDKDRRSVETPGRVVSRPHVIPTSKSVFIVRQPTGQSEPPSSLEEESHPKNSLLSMALTEALGKVTTVTKEAGMGDVMSVVELSPNKKVPVVVAERKEHAGKMIRVISKQPTQQLPLAVQKMVSLQLSRTASVQEGSESLFQQQTRTVTVRIGTPPPRTATEHSVTVDVNSDGDDNGKKAENPTDQSSQNNQASDSKAAQQSNSKSGHNLTCFSNVREHGLKKAQADVGMATTEILTTSSSDGSASCDDSGEEGEKNEEACVQEKYVTSGTQTPYTKKNFTKKVITVHVHPPSKDGENTEIITVTKVEKDDDGSSDDDSDSEGREELLGREVVNRKGKYIIVDLPGDSTAVKQPCIQHHSDTDSEEDSEEEEGEMGQEEGQDTKGEKVEKNEKYIIVDLPEGTTVKQPFVRRAERIDNDPDFYTMDEKGLFTCHICQYQSYRRANFYKHKKKHLGLRPYACDQCAYRAATTSNLKRHQEIHKDIRNHRCPVCGLYFRQKIHLERHIKYRHEEKKVKCPLCDYVCANENPDLKVHIKRRHIPPLGGQEALSAFKCPQCGMLANSKRDLRQHLKFHSKGPELKLFCNMCSFVTDCESRLRRHQYIHTKEKPFQCGLCDYRGSQKEHVLRHMRTQHNIEIERKHRIKKLGSEKMSEGEGSGSGSSKGLEKADYTSDEKIFACNHCNMKFSKLINLYKHLHTQHRDIMPMEKDDFSCVVCDFRTSSKKNLLVHMRRHNVADQSPPSHVYSCVLCRYMNPKRRNLFQHMRKKHHIEIVMRDDGSSTCYVPSDPVTGTVGSSGVVGAGGQSLTDAQQVVSVSQAAETVVNVLPITDLISTVTQSSSGQLQHHMGGEGTITINTSSGHTVVPTTIKMEDIALVVSNPHTGVGSVRVGGSSSVGMVEGGGVETFTLSGSFSQDDAAEAIQGLQALAQRGVLDPNCVASSGGTIMEEQVQVMGSDEQTTLVIEPSGLSLVEQLVTPKAEPLQVVEIDHTQLLHDPSPSASTSILSLGDSASTQVPVAQGEGTGFQLSEEQLMNLSTGDFLEINGEMFKVEVSTEGSQGQQIISFEPASVSTVVGDSEVCDASEEDLQQVSLVSSEVSLESTPGLP